MFCYDQGVFYALYEGDEMLMNLDDILSDFPVFGAIAIVAPFSTAGREAMEHCFGMNLSDDGHILRGLALHGTIDATPGDCGLQLEITQHNSHHYYDLSVDDDVLVFPEVDVPLSPKLLTQRLQALRLIGQVVKHYQPSAA